MSHNTTAKWNMDIFRNTKPRSFFILSGFQTVLLHFYLRLQKELAPESSAAGWWALPLNQFNWTLWEYEYGNGELKNGATGNSHEGHVAQRHCLAVYARDTEVLCAAEQNPAAGEGREWGVQDTLSFSLVQSDVFVKIRFLHIKAQDAAHCTAESAESSWASRGPTAQNPDVKQYQCRPPLAPSISQCFFLQKAQAAQVLLIHT